MRKLSENSKKWIGPIATDKPLSSTKKYWYCFLFSTKTYIAGTYFKDFPEALLMSTHNICFCGEIEHINTFLLKKATHFLVKSYK